MSEEAPKGELIIRTQAMPKDTNPDGDIFGGWLLSQMDIAGGILSKQKAQGRTVTVAIEAMTFHRPVFVGDTVCCYGDVIKVGNTSIAIKVEAWAQRQYQEGRVKVTEGIYTYVAVDKDRRPRKITQQQSQNS